MVRFHRYGEKNIKKYDVVALYEKLEVLSRADGMFNSNLDAIANERYVGNAGDAMPPIPRVSVPGSMDVDEEAEIAHNPHYVIALNNLNTAMLVYNKLVPLGFRMSDHIVERIMQLISRANPNYNPLIFGKVMKLIETPPILEVPHLKQITESLVDCTHSQYMLVVANAMEGLLYINHSNQLKHAVINVKANYKMIPLSIDMPAEGNKHILHVELLNSIGIDPSVGLGFGTSLSNANDSAVHSDESMVVTLISFEKMHFDKNHSEVGSLEKGTMVLHDVEIPLKYQSIYQYDLTYALKKVKSGASGRYRAIIGVGFGRNQILTPYYFKVRSKANIAGYSISMLNVSIISDSRLEADFQFHYVTSPSENVLSNMCPINYEGGVDMKTLHANASAGDIIHVAFELNSLFAKSPVGRKVLKVPSQIMLELIHLNTGIASVFNMRCIENASSYSLDIDLKLQEDLFQNLNGVYSLSIYVGDMLLLATPLKRNVCGVQLYLDFNSNVNQHMISAPKVCDIKTEPGNASIAMFFSCVLLVLMVMIVRFLYDVNRGSSGVASNLQKAHRIMFLCCVIVIIALYVLCWFDCF